MANRQGLRRGLFEKTLEKADHDREIATYKSGRTYKAVADHFGMSTSGVFEACERARTAARKPAGEALIADEVLELDALKEAAWAVLRANHIHISDGRVVKDDGALITDHKPVLMAIDRLLRIAERRARLLGLDAPTKQILQVVPAETVESEIQRLSAMLADNDARAQA